VSRTDTGGSEEADADRHGYIRVETQMTDWSEAEKAWMACAIDAEGTISLGPDHKHHAIHVKVSVCNTCFEFAQQFASLIGNKVHSRPPHGELSKKDLYEVFVTSKKNIRAVLDAVLPYLIVKRAKAEAVLAYIETHPLGRQANMALQNKVLPRTEQGHNQGGGTP